MGTPTTETKQPRLLWLLSFNGGFVDTAGFIGLQGLFTAHVTGNFVTLGARAIGIGERQHGVAETLFPRLVPDAFFNKALGPIAERTQRHTERCLLRLADASQALARVLPWEEG